MIHLATGVDRARRRLLLVASRYPNHASRCGISPAGASCPASCSRRRSYARCSRRPACACDARELAYVSESYDGGAALFERDVSNAGASRAARMSRSTVPLARAADHVVAVEWVPLAEVGNAHRRGAWCASRWSPILRGELPRRYAGFHEAGITIEWPARFAVNVFHPALAFERVQRSRRPAFLERSRRARAFRASSKPLCRKTARDETFSGRQ